MRKPLVMTVFGTRPEAIKMAPVVKTLQSSDQFDTIVAVTAQHREMLDQVLRCFRIVPDADLNIMASGQTLGGITSAVLSGMAQVFAQNTPDFVLVHGDTTTTMAAALAAYYARLPVGHVEAGLRTYDKYAPYPEEINRKIVGALADLHFAPTEQSKRNLLAEGVDEATVFVTGNTVIDALLMTVRPDYRFEDAALRDVDFSRRVLLLTCHRRENWGEPMRGIFSAVREITQAYPDIEIVFPVHSNPLVRQLAQESFKDVPRVHLIDPLSYEAFSHLMARCYFVLTDSGGIQEEAPALGKPVLVLRGATERPEAVCAGTARLIGVARGDIVRACRELLDDPQAYLRMAHSANPYGDGQASARIVSILSEYLSSKNIQ